MYYVDVSGLGVSVYAVKEAAPDGCFEVDDFPPQTKENQVLCFDEEVKKLFWVDGPTLPARNFKAEALQRINGKCSATIASGVDYNGKHYSLTETKQGYINNAYLEVLGGATQVKLAADGEDVTWHTAAQVTELFHKATGWGKICIYYKGYLSAWVDAETNTAVLDTIDYGTTLPSAYATSLMTKLSEEGIDITKYTTALTGG